MTAPLLLALLACGGDDTPSTSPTGAATDSGTLPAFDAEAAAEAWVAPGPHGVGYRTVTVSWSDPLLTGGEPRELRTSIWYPTDATTGDEARYQDLFEAEGVWLDAPLVPGPHPVAVFSHGHQAYGEAAGFLMEHLASHGWVAVAPDHTGNLTWDGGDRATEIYLQRPLDISAVLDWLDAPAGDPLEGQLGPERLGLGHSFGGYTLHALLGATYSEATIAGCDDGSPFCSTMTPELADRLRQGFRDPRLQAAVSMAPGDRRLFDDGLGDVGVPLFLMAGGLDDQTGEETDLTWSQLDDPGDHLAWFPAFGHNGFTDFAGVLDPAGVEDPATGWGTVQGLVLAWAGLRLEGLPAEPLLDGSVPVGQATVELTPR